MHLCYRLDEERRRIRNSGGLYYQVVEASQGGLYVGDKFIGKPEDLYDQVPQ
jgi:hypothetical protein